MRGAWQDEKKRILFSLYSWANCKWRCVGGAFTKQITAVSCCNPSTAFREKGRKRVGIEWKWCGLKKKG